MRHIPKPVKLLVLLTSIALTFVVGFGLGVHVGLYQFSLLEGSVKATLLAAELRTLRAAQPDKIQYLINSKEVALDGEIEKALRFRDEGHPWMFWPVSQHFEHDRYLRNVAKYRKEYPAHLPTLEFGGDETHKREMKAYAEEISRRTRQLIEIYGQ